MRFETIIFDLDGTLADTMPDVAKSINAALCTMNHAPLSRDQVRKAIGPGKEDFIRAVFPGVENPDEGTFLTLFRSHYWEHCLDQTRLFPEMETVLKRLDGFLAIASNKPGRFIDRIVQGLKIDLYFPIRLSADDVEEAKPHPEMIHRIIKSVDSSADKTLMIGDTDKDILAARRAGVKACAARYGYGAPETVDSLSPDYYIDAPMDILKIVSDP